MQEQQFKIKMKRTCSTHTLTLWAVINLCLADDWGEWAWDVGAKFDLAAPVSETYFITYHQHNVIILEQVSSCYSAI